MQISEQKSFPRVVFLADLRDAVLARSLTRSPIWRFRIADDLLLQLQPKPTRTISGVVFEALAIMAPGATAEMLMRRPNPNWPNYWRLEFLIVEESPTRWAIKSRRMAWAKGADLSEFNHLEARLVEAFTGDTFASLRPELLLRNNCLVCGKPLSDPASMARFVGPECFGSSSVRLPFMIECKEVRA